LNAGAALAAEPAPPPPAAAAATAAGGEDGPGAGCEACEGRLSVMLAAARTGQQAAGLQGLRLLVEGPWRAMH